MTTPAVRVRWTPEDDARLRAAWKDGNRKPSRIEAEVGRTWNSIRNRATYLGLKRPGTQGEGSSAERRHVVEMRRQRVLAAFKAGASVGKIAFAEDVHVDTICNDLDAIDPALRRKAARPRPPNREMAKLVASLHEAGVDKHQIAAATGLDLAAVESRLDMVTCKARIAAQAQAEYRALVGPVAWPKITMDDHDWPEGVVFEDVDRDTLDRELSRIGRDPRHLPPRTEVSSYMGNAGAMCAIQQGAI